MLRTARTVRGVPRRSKKKWGHVAESAAVYGADVLRYADIPDGERYECYVALYWNASRQRIRYAVSIATGIGLGMSHRWPREVFSAVADTPEEAEYLFQRSEATAEMEEAAKRNR